jgi:hypothetical protein
VTRPPTCTRERLGTDTQLAREFALSGPPNRRESSPHRWVALSQQFASATGEVSKTGVFTDYGIKAVFKLYVFF